MPEEKSFHGNEVLPVGIEPVEESSTKIDFFNDVYAKVHAYPELLFIIQKWKTLTEDERQGVIQLFKN